MEQRSIYPHQGGASPPRPPSEAPNLFTLSWASLVFGRSSAFPSIEASNVKVFRWQAKRIKFCMFFLVHFILLANVGDLNRNKTYNPSKAVALQAFDTNVLVVV